MQAAIIRRIYTKSPIEGTLYNVALFPFFFVCSLQEAIWEGGWNPGNAKFWSFEHFYQRMRGDRFLTCSHH
jgi:hypothetical protein